MYTAVAKKHFIYLDKAMAYTYCVGLYKTKSVFEFILNLRSLHALIKKNKKKQQHSYIFHLITACLFSSLLKLTESTRLLLGD